MKICKSCGAAFTPSHGNQTKCERCRSKKKRKKTATKKVMVCPCCGKIFETIYYKVYCSVECRDEMTKSRRKEDLEGLKIHKQTYTKPKLSLTQKAVIAHSYGLSYGKMDGLLSMANIGWEDHKKLGLKKRRCK